MVMGVCHAKKAVCRGGSWINNGRNLRSAYRNNDRIDIIDDNNGFRLARAHFAAGWRIRTRQHPAMERLVSPCKKQGCQGVSNRGDAFNESPLSSRLFLS